MADNTLASLLARNALGYGETPVLDSLQGDGVTYDTADILRRVRKPNALVDALRVAASSIPENKDLPAPQFPFDPRAMSMANALRGGLGTAANWLEGNPEIGKDTLAPLGAAAMTSMGLNAFGMLPENALGAAGARLGDRLRIRERLPMNDAARLARARELGFDTGTTWYHGTPVSGLASIQPGMRDPGAWFTTDLMNASNYAKGSDAQVHYTHLRTRNPFVVEADPSAEFFVPIHEGKPIPFDDNVSIVKHAQRNGYDSVHFPQGNFSESGNTMVVFDPSNIRSVDAAFNPKHADSGRLLAASAPPKSPILSYQDDQREDRQFLPTRRRE